MKAFVKDVGGAAYCGPTIVGAITGKPLSEVRDAIRETGGNRRDRAGRLKPVKGTSDHDIAGAFRRLGWKMTRDYTVYRKEGEPEPTLAAFLRKRTKKQREQTLVLVIGKSRAKPTLGRFGWSYGKWGGGHWVAVTGKKFVDTYTNGQWVWLSKAPHRRKRVNEVFVVEKA